MTLVLLSIRMDMSGQLSWRGGGRIAGIRRSGRLDQQDLDLALARDRPVLDALRHDKQFARPERDRSIPQFDIKLAVNDQKKIVRIVVLVPDKLAVELGDHYVVTVIGRDRARRETL